MTDPDDYVVALLLEALDDPATWRRLTGRLRPRTVGRPRPQRRLPRFDGVIRLRLDSWAISGPWLSSAPITCTMRAGLPVPCEPSPP